MSRLAVMLINNKEVHILKDGGSITITSGLAARTMNTNWPGISANCSGLDAFVRCAGMETPRGLRLNAVAPTTVTETAAAAGQGTKGTTSKATVANMYVSSALGQQTASIYLGGDPGAPKAFNKKVFEHIGGVPKSKL